MSVKPSNRILSSASEELLCVWCVDRDQKKKKKKKKKKKRCGEFFEKYLLVLVIHYMFKAPKRKSTYIAMR